LAVPCNRKINKTYPSFVNYIKDTTQSLPIQFFPDGNRHLFHQIRLVTIAGLKEQTVSIDQQGDTKVNPKPVESEGFL
jgi:hypothetical protein